MPPITATVSLVMPPSLNTATNTVASSADHGHQHHHPTAPALSAFQSSAQTQSFDTVSVAAVPPWVNSQTSQSVFAPQPQQPPANSGGMFPPPPHGGYYDPSDPSRSQQHQHAHIHHQHPHHQSPPLQNVPLFNPVANSTPIAPSSSNPAGEAGYIRMFDPAAYSTPSQGLPPGISTTSTN